MKTRVLLTLLSFLFVVNSSYAVNVVSKNVDEKSSQNQTNSLELKTKDSKFKTKMADYKLIKKIKNVLDDTQLILLVILALLLPPLAVWLKDGKSTSTLFWITLIFCILGGGFYWGWFFSGFWFIAMLLAILHVLDIL